MAMTKRYDHANEERYGAAIEALAAARWEVNLVGSESLRGPTTVASGGMRSVGVAGGELS